MKKEVKWVNCAKCVAILAVIIDHTKGVLYTNDNISYLSFFSVSLFIVISGMMSYLSNDRRKDEWGKSFIHAIHNILPAYLLATFVYQIIATGYFDFFSYIQYITHFNITGPFYYVLLYIQLMLISPLLYNTISRIPSKYQIFSEIILGAVILLISVMTTNYTNILDVYGGGGKLFGGTYLFLFYIGMLFSKHDLFGNITFKRSILTGSVSLLLCIIWGIFICHDRYELEAKLPFGNGINPPGFTLFIMAIIMLFLSFGIFSTFCYIRYLKWIVKLFSWLGKHTLYIFLYHRLFLDYFLNGFIAAENIWIKRVFYFTCMLLAPVLLEYVIGILRKLLGNGGKKQKK